MENQSSSHVLIRLIENGKQALEKKFFGNSTYGYIKSISLPHSSLIAKLHSYGFSENALRFK